MGTGERVLCPAELVNDSLALFPGADSASLYGTPTSYDTGYAFPVGDRCRCLFVHQVANDVIDDSGLFYSAKDDRHCTDKERIAAKLLKEESFSRKGGKDCPDNSSFPGGPVQDIRADEFL